MGLDRTGRVLDSDPQQHHTLTLSDLCEDVILLVSDQLRHMRAEPENTLLNLSCVNKRLRHILAPRVFRSLSINQPVSQLTPATFLGHYAQSLKIDMFGSLWWWCSGSYTSSSDAIDMFACIQGLKELRHLEISMMRRSIDIFTAAFKREDGAGVFMLDHVEELVVTSSAAFLTNHCPNLKSLVVKDDESECLLDTYMNLPQRLAPLYSGLIKHTPHLTSFDATAIWSLDELSSLVSMFPDLEHLRMRSDTYCYRASTPSIIKVLGESLKRLKTLKLVKTGSLGMGYQSVWKRRIQSCSNIEYRRMLWRENERLKVCVENQIVRDAFKWITSLKECWLSEMRVARKCDECVESEDGIRWIWERRSEDVDDCVMANRMFMAYRMEKEAVVVGREMGF
jgi:hypothetical protein